MKTNSAVNLLRHIGGTAAAMLDTENERIALRAFQRQEAIDNPKEKRMAQPLRSYLKRYRNNIAEYLMAQARGKKRLDKEHQS